MPNELVFLHGIVGVETDYAALIRRPDVDEAARMAQAAERTGTLLMEAFHYRFHPAFAQAIEIVRGGDLGRLQKYEGHFSVDIPERDGELRHELALGRRRRTYGS